MSQIKLIALDMDGTLLNDNHEVTPYTKDVIKKALAKDIHVILTTGRPLHMCSPYAEELNLPSYIITSNGAEIYTYDHKLVEQHILPVAVVEKLWDIGEVKRIDMWMIATDRVFTRSSRPKDFADHSWLKFGYGELTTEQKLYVMDALNQLEPLEITNSSPVNVEVNKKDVHKANALRSVCKQLGFAMDQVLAIGDSLNDFHMLKEAGIGVAVGNAQEVIADAADYVTDSNNDDGVAKAIERFALNEK